jgi:hypothetical protein
LVAVALEAAGFELLAFASLLLWAGLPFAAAVPDSDFFGL